MIDKVLFTGHIKSSNKNKLKLKKPSVPVSAPSNPIEDKFEKGPEAAAYNENDNLMFKKEVLKFYPKDVIKMSGMSVEERIEYRRKLKDANRYIILDENMTGEVNGD